MWRSSLVLLLSALAVNQAASQTPPPDTVLEFTGSPLALPFPCVEDDLQWAGLSCAEEACPIYAELLHADGRGNTILVTGDFHGATATLASLLLRTEDGGHTWREPFARLRGAELERVQMYDAQTAWVSGQSVQPIALDPFFLVTANGGKNWDRVPLFEEGTPGTILDFAFDSRDHGLALVDRGGGPMRYEVYESDSGGHTWTLKQSTGTMPKFPPPPASDWRLTPAPKLFRLEHNEGGRWSPFATFAVAAASCRGTPAPERQPPQ